MLIEDLIGDRSCVVHKEKCLFVVHTEKIQVLIVWREAETDPFGVPFEVCWCYGLGLEFCPLDNFCVLSISCLLVLLSAFLIQVFTNSQKLMPIKGVYCPCHNENNLPDCHNVTQSFVLLLNNRSLSLLKLPPDYPFTFIITVMLFTHSYLYRCFKMGFYKKKTYSFYCTRLFQMSPHDSGVLSFISIEDILTHICSNRGSISDKKQVMFVYNILWPFTHWPVSRFMSVYSNIAWYQLVSKCLHSIGLLLSFVLFKKARN